MASYGSAEEALMALADNPPDVVLMDINLPLRSGIECLMELKKTYPQVQILILTSSEDSRQNLCRPPSGREWLSPQGRISR